MMHEPKVSALCPESVIASSECTTLKHTVPGKCVLNVLFLVKVTFNQADVLKTYTIDGSRTCTLKHYSLVTYSDWFGLVSKLSTLKLCNIYLMHT